MCTLIREVDYTEAILSHLHPRFPPTPSMLNQRLKLECETVIGALAFRVVVPRSSFGCCTNGQARPGKYHDLTEDRREVTLQLGPFFCEVVVFTQTGLPIRATKAIAWPCHSQKIKRLAPRGGRLSYDTSTTGFPRYGGGYKRRFIIISKQRTGATPGTCAITAPSVVGRTNCSVASVGPLKIQKVPRLAKPEEVVGPRGLLSAPLIRAISPASEL
ncbi:unnamed protein product, partial [Iphiclides podalirius]